MLKPPLPQLPKVIIETCRSLANSFQIDNKKGGEIITEGQLHIFAAIVFRIYKRVQIICSTQYGKSLWVALACIIVACIQGIKIAVLAPNDDKAKIIMRYFIEHLGDSKLYYSQLEKNSRLERLRQEDSKERIILRNGGGIFVISAQQRNASKSIEAAMGEGAKVVIGDEFNLIQDTTEATIFRMIAGKGPEAFYCKIGNPFYSMPPYSHFKTTWESALYHKIFIDAAQALKEGRYTQEFLDEAKDKPLYSILFDCEFPPEDVIDEKGYRPLLVSDSFKFGVTRALMLEMLAKARAEGELKIRPKLGCDIAGGGDDNAYVVRWGKFACVAGKNRTKDTMVNIGEIEGLMKEFGVKDEDVSIDDIGIGRGVTDRMIELGHNVNGVNVGEPAKDSETYANLKAELNWNAKKWIEREDSRLNKNDDWLQGTWVKYKVNSDKQLKLESKEDLKKKHGSKSPDIWDAFVLTFYEPGFVGFI